MHNGGLADFHLIKRRLQTSIPDVAFDMVQGNTGKVQSLLVPDKADSMFRLGMGVRVIFVQGCR